MVDQHRRGMDSMGERADDAQFARLDPDPKNAADSPSLSGRVREVRDIARAAAAKASHTTMRAADVADLLDAASEAPADVWRQKADGLADSLGVPKG